MMIYVETHNIIDLLIYITKMYLFSCNVSDRKIYSWTRFSWNEVWPTKI